MTANQRRSERRRAIAVAIHASLAPGRLAGGVGGIGP